ncbi:hypothetical protein RclHR1_37820001 [Rhizophagus clarus]|uniref:Uncharacterized protein n=1 Tax=Rhizophagus clarus TaxID=94130 RepID=A0A2Z6RT67_9GLOM|nr:hypothetical protein RclHR1_37820001 [Rhizophagus clarus]
MFKPWQTLSHRVLYPINFRVTWSHEMGRSRRGFLGNSAAKSEGTSSGITITMSFIVMVILGGGCGRVPAKDIIANLERDFGRGRVIIL